MHYDCSPVLILDSSFCTSESGDYFVASGPYWLAATSCTGGSIRRGILGHCRMRSHHSSSREKLYAGSKVGGRSRPESTGRYRGWMQFGSRLFETGGDKHSQVSSAQTCQALWSCRGTLLLFLYCNSLQSIILYFSNDQESIISVIRK